MCVCKERGRDGQEEEEVVVQPSCLLCFRATRWRGGFRSAGYHRGDWEIKVDCVELSLVQFHPSFGSPSDPLIEKKKLPVEI